MVQVPPLANQFSVVFCPRIFGINLPDIFPWDMAFQKVAGIGSSIAMRKFNEGGENLFVHRLPDRVEYENLVLERGLVLIPSKAIIGLSFSPVTKLFVDAMEKMEFDPCDVLVILHGTEFIPLAAWKFRNAFPVKWKISDFNASDEAIVVDHMELAFQTMWSVRI
ncbi:MAG: phage tail protein [Candidatus Methylumidiphilus alinenensis]|uniref:Phage tail protein n=1 Tax=Candidatus Methylumidiphilus alinenensis TaxID=2202197 RepID=A0A2W4QSA1_9GAMM|nr:MAG: phage tail protein [Candidatus Methylumidiphilus alinenensis]